MESCVLPLLEINLRSGSILDISKEPALFKNYLELIRKLSKNINTIDCLLEISKEYKPEQTESIYSLLGKLSKTADIFLSCINTSKEELPNKAAEEIAHDIHVTYQEVQKAVEDLNKVPEEE